MFSDGEWAVLIAGLVKATTEGRIHWTEREPVRAGILSVLSIAALRGNDDVLIAQVGNARYEVSAAYGGGAPYGLYVVEKVEGEEVVRGSLNSSTSLAYEGVQQSNLLLKELYAVARGTVEAGGQVVARLLQDLESSE